VVARLLLQPVERPAQRRLSRDRLLDGGVEPVERSGSPGDPSPDGPSPLPVEDTPGDGTGAEVLAFRARPA
jgi:hypothetical protein